MPTLEQMEPWMRLALERAAEAARSDEVPVGAVVVRLTDFAVLGQDHERKIEQSDPTAHAEVLALRAAAQAGGDWRLEQCALVVTLEPCLMCAGATLLSRIPLLVYGAENPKFGAVRTQMRTLEHPGWNHRVEVISGILAEECGTLLKQFFARKRGR